MKKLLLIVDDEAIVLKSLSSQFDRKIVDVMTATNGLDGLKISLKEHPDLILLDLVMPKMDGMTMLSKLRADKWGKKAKVIILTNLSDAERVAQAVEKGTYEYLVKVDWNVMDVVKKCKKYLGI
jgi:two-component system alkaline phosphatase synthesis response regulator PhoP